MDVLKEELNDELLSEVCLIKSTGSALSKLGALGKYLPYIIGFLHESLYGLKAEWSSVFHPRKSWISSVQ